MPEKLGMSASAGQAATSQRQVYFGPDRGWIDTPVLDRIALNGSTQQGPLIIEEYDSTTVVPPTWRASADQWRNIILER